MKNVYSSGLAKLPGLHVMDETEIKDLSFQLQELLLGNSESGKVIFTLDELSTEKADTPYIRATHFSSQNVFFINYNSKSEMNGVISFLGLDSLSPVVAIGLLVVFSDDSEEYGRVAINILKQSEEALRSIANVNKIRVVIKNYSCSESENDNNVDIQAGLDRKFLYEILNNCGYRKEAFLKNEVGLGIDIEYYTKQLET